MPYPHGRRHVVRVEVRELLRGNFSELVLVDAPHDVTAGPANPCALRDAHCLLDEHGRRGRLEDEREALVLEHGDDGWDDLAALLRSFGIIFFAEGHDVDALGTEGWTHRR